MGTLQTPAANFAPGASLKTTGTINPATLVTEINPKLFQGAVLQAQADLQNAQASLTAAKANLVKDGAC